MRFEVEGRELEGLWVKHRCGHWVFWTFFLEETTLDEEREGLEAMSCLRCRKAEELLPG